MIEYNKAREMLGEDFNKMRIPLNGPDVSDVIFMDKALNKRCIYYNAFTGKESNVMTDVIRKDRKFILLTTPRNQIINGVYVKHEKVHDILLVVSARLVEDCGIWHWEEERPEKGKITRSFLTKDCQNYAQMIIREDAIDMREQVIAIENMDNKLPTISYSAMTSEIYKFFGGFLSTPIVNFKCKFHPSLLESLMRFFSADEDTRKKYITGAVDLYKTDEKNYFNNKSVCITNVMPIPEEAVAKMQDYAVKILKDSIEYDNEHSRRFDNYTPEFGIVQKLYDKVYQRTFRCIPDYSFPVENTTYSIFETERIRYGSEVTTTPFFKMVYVIWRDDLTGTVMEFTADIIDDAINLYDKKIKEKNYFLSDLYNSMYIDLFCNSVVPVYGATYLAGAIGSYPFLESFYRIDRELGLNAMRVMARSLLTKIDSSVKDTVYSFFKPVDIQGKDINKALGLPKGFLQCLFKGGENPGALRYIKYAQSVISATKESEEYFSRINKEDIEYMITNSSLRYKTPGGIDCMDAWEMMGDMIKVFGYEKWKGFLRHINSLHDMENGNDEINLYYSYIIALSSLGEDVAKNAEWKLSGEALKRTYDSLLIAKEYKKIEEMTGGSIMEKFNDYINKMEAYKFSYDGLTIRIPQNPEEIIAEGLYLKHCAKEFVIPVSCGYTNILFIRKEDAPEKPYYTLELRDGEVRQCHGSCNAKAKEDVREFIDHFCKEKGLTASKYDGVFGVKY